MSQKTKEFSIENSADETEVRLVDNGGSRITTLKDAKETADREQLDLVVVGDGELPVLKICNYSKLLYENKKKLKSTKNKVIETKTIKLGVNISEHDIEIKAKQINKLLKDGCKVNIMITFSGREVKYINTLGVQLLDKVISLITVDYKVVNKPAFSGNNIMTTLQLK